MKLRLTLLCLTLVFESLASSNSLGDTYDWNNPGGGSFDFPGNWDPVAPPGPPGSSDEARFLIPGTYAVTFPSNVSTFNLDVSEGDVTFVLSGSSYEVLNAAVLGVGSSAPSSLTVFGGQLNIAGQFDILSGATLSGDQATMISAGTSFNVANGGALRGSFGVIAGTGFNNRGLIAPGADQIGSLTIQSTGNFRQFGDGTLEIQISGSSNDMLVFSGFGGMTSTILGGNLRAPLINGYVPQVNDSFTFLNLTQPGSTIVGQFESLSVPGLSSGIAARVDYGASSASITFVASQTVGFNSNYLLPPPGFREWNDENLWQNNAVPDSTSIVNLSNPRTFDTRVQLDPGSPAAFTHRTNISGSTHSMTLAVGDDTDFTAVERFNVNNRGILQLAGGTVHSPLVKVNPGGQLIGNGKIDGNVLIGATTGTLRATLSPGASTGTLDIAGDLTMAANVDTIIEVVADNDFDKIIVGQDANLGGTLKVDIAMGVDPDDLIGVPLAVINAGDVNFEFDDIVLLDDENGYFVDVDYSSLAVAMSVGLDGDMNYNGVLDAGDIPLFATGLTNPVAYTTIHVPGESPVDPGNMNEDPFFDFDDIEEFSQLPFPNLTAEEVVAAIFAYTSAVPEPSSSFLVFIAIVMKMMVRRPLFQ